MRVRRTQEHLERLQRLHARQARPNRVAQRVGNRHEVAANHHRVVGGLPAGTGRPQGQRRGCGVAGGAWLAGRLEAERDVVAGTLPGQQARLLEHQRGIAEGVFEAALLQIEQARAQVQQRGLAAARGADQRQHAAGRKRQAHAAEHLGERVAVPHVLQ